jgi:hypothetical protein
VAGQIWTHVLFICFFFKVQEFICYNYLDRKALVKMVYLS